MSVSGGPDIVQDGLVLYLDAANPRSYVSGSTTWVSVGTDNISGSLINGPNFSYDVIGSLVFNGTNQQIIISSSVNLEPTSDFTISTWLYRPIIVSGLGVITKGPETGDYDYMLYVGGDGTGISLFKKDSSGNGQNLAGMSFPVNQWVNFTYTLSGGNSVIGYTNGIRVVNGTYTNTGVRASTSPLRIGRGWSTWYSGSVSTTQLYNRVLSAQEILQNYNAQRSRFGI